MAISALPQIARCDGRVGHIEQPASGL